MADRHPRVVGWLRGPVKSWASQAKGCAVVDSLTTFKDTEHMAVVWSSVVGEQVGLRGTLTPKGPIAIELLGISTASPVVVVVDIGRMGSGLGSSPTPRAPAQQRSSAGCLREQTTLW